jgi:tRNA modification GTPase
LERADAILAILDGSRPLEAEDRRLLAQAQKKPHVVVINKADLPAQWKCCDLGLSSVMVPTSAMFETGLDELRDAIRAALVTQELEAAEGVVITHLRHHTALGKAQESLNHVRNSLEQQMPAECLALDLRAAMVAIGEIIGETTIDEVLDRIFQEFCIGK